MNPSKTKANAESEKHQKLNHFKRIIPLKCHQQNNNRNLNRLHNITNVPSRKQIFFSSDSPFAYFGNKTGPLNALNTLQRRQIAAAALFIARSWQPLQLPCPSPSCLLWFHVLRGLVRKNPVFKNCWNLPKSLGLSRLLCRVLILVFLLFTFSFLTTYVIT